jgi:hypothetical protein
MTIPNLLIETAEMLLEWGCAKLTGGEGFGVLMLSHHPDGKRMHNFGLDSVEASLECADAELRTKWHDLTSYVLCYDVTISFPAQPERGFLFEAEDMNAGGRYNFFHGTAQASTGKWSPVGNFRLLEAGGQKRIASRHGT